MNLYCRNIECMPKKKDGMKSKLEKEIKKRSGMGIGERQHTSGLRRVMRAFKGLSIDQQFFCGIEEKTKIKFKKMGYANKDVVIMRKVPLYSMYVQKLILTS